MKIITLMAGLCLLLFACKKNTSTPANHSGQTSWQVASIYIYSPSVPSLIIDTFVYDGNQNMIRAGCAEFDSLGGTAYIDSGSYYFTFNSGSRVPAAYQILWSRQIVLPGPPVLQNESHGLIYDKQDRLTGDTLLVSNDSTNAPDAMTWYSYAGGSIVAATGNTPDSIDVTDSLVFNGAGNLIREADYVGPLAYPWNSSVYNVSAYSTYPNPLYNTTNALNIGVFLLNNGIVDGVSKNLPADNITKWNTDGSGRVLSSIASDGTITTYSYN